MGPVPLTRHVASDLSGLVKEQRPRCLSDRTMLSRSIHTVPGAGLIPLLGRDSDGEAIEQSFVLPIGGYGQDMCIPSSE